MGSLAKIQKQILTDIFPSEAYALIQNNRDNHDFIILDVRTVEEFIEKRIKHAANLDYFSESFEVELDKLDKNKIYLLYCTIGGRSAETLKKMKELGFREGYNMTGGILLWEEKGLPTTTVQFNDDNWNTKNPEIYVADNYEGVCCQYA